MIYSRIILIFVVFVSDVYLLENGLARTPPMGWMSWGYYMCGVDCKKNPNKCLNEELIISVADSFFSEGYQEAGYEYIIIDDCWSEKTRDVYGKLVPDHQRFPNGMKYLADYIHSKGLKFGMYTNIADVTCMNYPGSKNFYYTDAQTFADWGVDYIKVDGCFVGESDLNIDYIKLGSYLNKTGRPILYSCSWPYYIQFIHKKAPNFETIAKYCNMWRNYHDVSGSWESVLYIINHFVNEYDNIHQYHGPGHWNDPDMLLFGQNILRPEQSRVLISTFAMLSAPLLLSCNMKQMQEYEKKLLLNLDLIAVAQDPLGIMAEPHILLDEQDDQILMWVKPHLPMKGDRYLSYSFVFTNIEKERDTSITITPKQYGLNATDGYTVLDVFTGDFIRNITLDDNLTVFVHIDDAVFYTLYPL